MSLFFIDIGERIMHIISTRFDGNKRRFAKSIGFAPQVISNIVTGRKSKPSFDLLKAIISTNDDINGNWLLTGEGEILLKDVSLDLKKITDYQEKYIKLLEENKELLSNNISLEKELLVFQSTHRNAAESEDSNEYKNEESE